jgi:osmotically inducible protein OsmC
MTRKKAQAESTASATWSGSLVEGSGTLTGTGSGAIAGLPISWAARTGSGGMTTPEELLAAAHASCYSMALSHALAGNGTPATKLDVTATVGFDPKVGGGFEVSFSHLTVHGHVPGIDAARFAELAQEASQGCPISGALKGNVEIIAEASLA